MSPVRLTEALRQTAELKAHQSNQEHLQFSGDKLRSAAKDTQQVSGYTGIRHFS